MQAQDDDRRREPASGLHGTCSRGHEKPILLNQMGTPKSPHEGRPGADAPPRAEAGAARSRPACRSSRLENCGIRTCSLQRRPGAARDERYAMSAMIAFLSKLADRPSTIWRLAWLMFCLIIVCFFGARTLRRIAPYVLAGIGDTPTARLLPEKAAGSPDDDGRFAVWVLPVMSWLVLGGAMAWFLIHKG